MSLMQLLAVGRSIGTVTDEPSRYKMTQQRLLPRFGPLKEGDGACCMEPPPLGEEAAAAVLPKSVLPSAQSDATEEVAGQVTSAGSRTEPAQPCRVVPLEQSANITENRVSGRGLRKVASPWRGWSLLGNPFKTARSPARHAGPVQAELALDMIRPVRNDLNDTDLEIVAPRTKPVPTAAPNSPPGSDRLGQSVGALWGRLRNVLSCFRTRQT